MSGEIIEMSKKILKVIVGIENYRICGKGAYNVGAAIMHISLFPRGKGVGKLIFMEIEEDRRAGFPPQSFQVGGAHQGGGNYQVIHGWVGNLPGKLEGGTPHSPFPEPRREGVQGDGVA